MFAALLLLAATLPGIAATLRRPTSGLLGRYGSSPAFYREGGRGASYVFESLRIGGYPPGNAVDGNAASYWESTNNAFPQTIISVNGGSPARYVFDPANGNAVTVPLPATARQYVRLTFTGNTGWPAGQLSEVEAYAS